MRAPPESLMPMTGAPTRTARSMTLQIFSACGWERDPPKTVKSCEKTKTRRPLIVPWPVPTPSPGMRWSAMPNSVQRCSTNRSVSSKEPGSSSSSSRSRALSLPRACWAAIRFLPPPSLAPRRLSSSWSTMSCNGRSFPAWRAWPSPTTGRPGRLGEGVRRRVRMAVAAVRLPVLGMVGRAFEDVWASLGGVARMAWPGYAAALAPTLPGEVAASYGAGSALWDVAAGLAGGAAVLACSARWQRHLIMGESLRRPARLDRNVGRYAAALLRVLMLGAAPVGLAVLGVVLVGAVRPGADGRPWAGAGAVGTGLVVAGLLAGGLVVAGLLAGGLVVA